MQSPDSPGVPAEERAGAAMPAGSRPGWQRSQAAHWATVAAVALLGAWLGLLAAGSTTAKVGPVEMRFSAVPSLTGDSVLRIPPLGSLTLDTHDGPVRLDADIVQVDATDARRILGDPAMLNGLEDRVVGDLRAGILRLALQSGLAAGAGAFLAALLVLRRPRTAAVAGGTALGVLAAGAGMAAVTFDPRAVAQPRYDGLLTIAPTVVGDAEDIVGNFDKYRQQLAQIVTNVSQLYDVTSGLPTYDPDPSTVRVLFVADIHLNPAAFDVMRSVATQFQTDFVIDAGDLTDRGSAPEDRFASLIPTMGQPYVFVRGNHDSARTERAVESQDNAVVLRDGEVVELEGLRIIGAGDPRFTPDKRVLVAGGGPTVEEAGAALADAVRGEVDAGRRVDIALVHDTEMARPLDGLTPLALSGHGHARAVTELEGGTRSFQQGSTGGAGLRGLEGEQPTPIQLSVLYFDRDSGTLQAWDDISIGGLGLASAQIERTVPAAQAAVSAERTGAAEGTG